MGFIAIHFPIRIAFAESHNFWCVVFPFMLVSKDIFNFPFDFFFDTSVV